MSHLVLISLGPVQEFIASARRSRDLWFGSWLLSELAKAAAAAIVDREGLSSLIFPAPATADELAAGTPGSVANKILARIERSDPIALAKEVEAAVYARLRALRDGHAGQTGAFQRIDGPYHEDVARAQVDDLPEFYWVALPLPDSAEYPLVRARLEALLAARKATRDFGLVPWELDAPKSSLDGIRESVIPEAAYPGRGDSAEEKAHKVKNLYRLYRAGPAERLSGVDLLKRHGQPGTTAAEPIHFASTSHIAALPFMSGLVQGNRTAATQAWNAYVSVLEQDLHLDLQRIAAKFPLHQILGDYEGDLLFEERLADLFEGEPIKSRDDPRLVRARAALREFFKQIGDPPPPLPYYALLLADGDRMGKAIDYQRTLEQHQALSHALDRFVTSVRGEPERSVRYIVERKHQGALVYAGGDDVLAFLPVHTVLDCAAELAALFSERLAKFVDNEKRTPTLSAGIVIAHHLEPLSDTLDLAREAERTAKRVPGKNALAITVSKRSGADTTVFGPRAALYERLTQMAALYQAGDLAAGAAYQLRDLACHLWPRPPRTPALPKTSAESQPAPVSAAPAASDAPAVDFAPLLDVMLTEAGRILSRSEGGRGARALSKDQVEELKRYIGQVAAEQPPMKLGDPAPLAEFADELIVAHELARAATLAGMSIESPDTQLAAPAAQEGVR